jgi:hypothetical protein
VPLVASFEIRPSENAVVKVPAIDVADCTAAADGWFVVATTNDALF